jgi:hypothetical protein
MVRWFVIAIALSACGDKQLEALEDVRDEVCACKTPECGEAALKKVPQGTIKTSQKMRRVAAEMMDCVAKLNEAQRPSTDPDAETPGPVDSAAPP